MNPGRCKEEAEFRDAAATGSVKTHFANTLAFLFGVQYNFEPSKEEAYLVDSIYHSHAAAEMCKKCHWEEALASQFRETLPSDGTAQGCVETKPSLKW